MSLSRYIFKSPIANESNTVYLLDEINDNTIQNILNSRFISDSIYALEQYSDGEYMENFFISPTNDKHDYEESSTSWEFDNKNIFYELRMQKHSFLPLDTNKFMNTLGEIANFNFPIFTQILICKRTDSWRELLINQYDDYLNGNDEPMDNKVLRSMQNQMLKVFSKITNYQIKRDPIKEIDNKILQDGYRMELRFALYNSNQAKLFEQKIGKILSQLNLFNQLCVEEISKSEIVDYVAKRSMKEEVNNTIFSKSEIISLLCSESIGDNVLSSTKIKSATNIIRHMTNNYLNEGVKLLPYEEKINVEVDKELEKQIIGAFKRVNISKEPLKVTDITRGSRIQRIECKIPKDKNYDSIKKNLTNIQAALGNQNVSLEIGNKPETVDIYLPCTDVELIYLKSILESEEFNEYASNKTLPFILGEDEIGNKLFSSLSDIRHLLIAGTSGSGKSVFINCILITFLLHMNPEELSLYLIDPKMVELSPYQGFPQVKEVITDMRKASKLLENLTVEMDKRYEILNKEGYRDIKGLNNSGKMKLPYIVCVIDEYADLIGTNPEVDKSIQRLGQKARAAGIHLIVATQRPSSDVLNGSIKVNLSARIGFKMETSSDYKTVFGTSIPFKPLGQGDGCAVIEGLPKQYQRFQSPLITLDDEEWKELIVKLKDMFKNIELNDVDLAEVEIEEPIDKLKRLIIENNETRVGQLREMMGVRMNEVSDMMKQLLDEGFLVKNGRSYEIVNDDE